jgi:hypothetical protein
MPGLFFEIGSLSLNCDSPDIPLLSFYNYRHAPPPFLALFALVIFQIGFCSFYLLLTLDLDPPSYSVPIAELTNVPGLLIEMVSF